jgi:hypothetical protein
MAPLCAYFLDPCINLKCKIVSQKILNLKTLIFFLLLHLFLFEHINLLTSISNHCHILLSLSMS